MEHAASLKARLDWLYDRYGASYLATDPVQFPHRYARDDDREVAGFLASALAYGRVAQVRRSVETVLAYLGDHPGRAARTLPLVKMARDLRGFAHRFNTGRDVAILIHILGTMQREEGSIGAAFARSLGEAHDDVGEALSAFCRRALDTPIAPLTKSGRIPATAGVRFFFSSPAGGSSCKRLNLFLRWMVRRDAIDLGVWPHVPASKLVVPLDTHVARISRYIGLSDRLSADWKMALEVTRSLRALDPADPVRYDFAICRLGILDACPARRDPVKCAGCGIRSICRLPAAAGVESVVSGPVSAAATAVA